MKNIFGDNTKKIPTLISNGGRHLAITQCNIYTQIHVCICNLYIFSTFLSIYSKPITLVLGDMLELGKDEIMYHKQIGEFLSKK